MGKNRLSWDYSLAGMTSSFFVRVDDEPVVENWMEVDGSAFARDFQKTSCVGTTASSLTFLKAFFVAFVVSFFEAVVKTLSITSPSRFFYVI